MILTSLDVTVSVVLFTRMQGVTMLTDTTVPIQKGMEVMPKTLITVNGVKLQRKGIVREIVDSRVLVGFNLPNTPVECAQCGSLENLSYSASSGQVECLATGCGHEHGFKEFTTTLPIATIEPLFEYNRRERDAWLVTEAQLLRDLESAQNALNKHREHGRKNRWCE